MKEKSESLYILAVDGGGYIISHPSTKMAMAAFSTLPEALKWLSNNLRCREGEAA